jgi:hypothetical protein
MKDDFRAGSVRREVRRPIAGAEVGQSAISTRRFATSASRWSFLACGICRNQARSLGRRFAKASYTAAVHPPKTDRRASSNLRGQGVEKFAGPNSWLKLLLDHAAWRKRAAAVTGRCA